MPSSGQTTLRHWAIALAVVVVLLAGLPCLGRLAERAPTDPDYRVPHELSEDYWYYAQRVRASEAPDIVPVVGDSMVWGEYVPADETLSHHLSERATIHQFANLGLSGVHPIALTGLVRNFGGALKNRRVLVHFNPLWMSSPRQDLQGTKEFHFNHAQLVPQFIPKIPCYKDPASVRVKNVLDTSFSHRAWASHLRITRFDGVDFPSWTLENPYTVSIPERLAVAADSAPQRDPKPWTERGMVKQNFPWVTLDTSLQWQLFGEMLGVLNARGNHVFVLVGPFNEHLLEDESRAKYAQIKNDIEAWLSKEDVPFYIPEPLPSELYADASHPLSEGYAALADQLLEKPTFQRFLK